MRKKHKEPCTFRYNDESGDVEAYVSLTPSIIEFEAGNVVVARVKGRRGLVFRRDNGKSDSEGEGCLWEDGVRCSSSAINSDTVPASYLPCSDKPCVFDVSPLDYVRGMISATLVHGRGKASKVASIGQGIGGIPRWISHNVADLEVYSVDNSPEVVQVAPCFGLVESSMLRLVTADGHSFVEALHDRSLSILWIDVFDRTTDAIPRSMSSAKFFETAASRLAPGGVLAMNTHGNGKILATAQKVFGWVKVLKHRDIGDFGFVARVSGGDKKVAAMRKSHVPYSWTEEIALTDHPSRE